MPIESKMFGDGQGSDYTNFKKETESTVVREKVRAIKTKRTQIIYEHKYEHCNILERRSQYSYLLYMGNECQKIIHANKIRKYYTRALACGLIPGKDEEFGSVVEVPLKKEEQRKEGLSIDAEQINHLSTEQQGQLQTILNKYQDRFTGNTGLRTLVEHEIELKPDFRVKEFAAYRIPFAYRPEVEIQIRDMLQQGIIKLYTRRIARPRVLFVRKKKGLFCPS